VPDRRSRALPRDLAANQRRTGAVVTRTAAQRAERAALDTATAAATHPLVASATHHLQPDLSQKLDTGHHSRPRSEGLSDAATTLWFAARRRDRRAAAMGAIQPELVMTIDGTPQPFLRLSAPTGRWVAVRRHDDLIITIAVRDIDPTALTLEPIADPQARLLGPEPEETQDHPA
jgi:hypothetical protein